MAMPCCSQHQSTECHEICAAPAGNINATLPQLTGELQTVATISPVVLLPQRSAVHVLPCFAPSTENLLTRIHVLLI